MTTVTINIDSNSGHGVRGTHLMTPDKVGLLSSITLTDDLIQAFEDGLSQGGTVDKEVNAGYKKSDIKTKKNNLKANGNKVIATVGGLVMPDALADETTTMPPFVSLVGSVPTFPIGNCRGGVSLESYKLNAMRKNYLIGKGHAPANIYLLTNSNSKFHSDERSNWSNLLADPTFLESYVGDGAGNNDASRFSWDFFGNPPGVGTTNAKKIPDTATAVIIGDDPFFQASRTQLFTQANQWLMANAARHIVYPSQIYQTDGAGLTPRGGQSTLIGPDLLRAFQLLGILASGLAKNKGLNFGFFMLAPETVPL